MPRRNTVAFSLVSVVVPLAGAIGLSTRFVISQATAATPAIKTSAKGMVRSVGAPKSADLSKLPGPDKKYADPRTLKKAPETRELMGRGASTWEKINSAKSNPNAPRPNMGQAAAPTRTSAANATPYTPYAGSGFKGLDDSRNPTVNGGYIFHPADLAVASSPSYVVEAVNNCIAVYNTSGALQSGFPKSPRTFFNVPMPAPSGCAGSFNQPFLTDPRAFYDPNDQRFVISFMQADGVLGVNTCTPTSKVWVAVSKTNNPVTGGWWTYGIHMLLPNGDAVDYDQLGFDSQGIYLSANMFNTSGSYSQAQICGLPKAKMEAGQSVSAYCFTGLTATGTSNVLVDTVQPVLNQTPAYSPRGQIFVNTFNINGDPNGNDCFTTSCTGMAVWVFSNIGNWANGGHAPVLTGTIITNTKTYIAPPSADSTECTACVETLDTRISSTPVYSHGFVWAAWSTGVTNYEGNLVPGILWGQMRIGLNDQDPNCVGANDVCSTVSTSYQEQGYYFFLGGTNAAYFPAIMTDAASNLFMVYDTSSATTPRSVWYVSRRAEFKTGMFHDYGRVLKAGTAGDYYGAFGERWGDYSASSYDGPAADHPWFCGQYTGTNASTGLDWGTWCTKVNYTLACT